MKEATARDLIAAYLGWGEIFNRITKLSGKVDDVEVRRAIRSGAAEAQLQLYDGLVRPVLAQYPALVPHEDG
jgi:hypothetical protein